VLALARKLRAEVCEWINPVVQQDYDNEGRPCYGDSLQSQFLVGPLVC
jgi:hypothetical protein